MGASANDSDDEITGINVTPLVDVMLVLLIIFMVTATYIVNRSIAVNLPKADSGESSADKAKNLAFVLDAKSQLYLDGKPVNVDEVPELLKAEQQKAGSSSLSAVISADKDTPHGAVVKLIDTVRKYGITDFAINVEAGHGGP